MSDAGAPSSAASTAWSGPLRSRRLLVLAGDRRLVEQIRHGNEAAFEVVFERHAAAILGFCRHMLGSREEAEDAVQHTFAAAFHALRRGGERELALKPWLFAIARNRCVSVLRGRRELPAEDLGTAPTEDLAEQAERRAELRRLVADVRELPDEQRAALLLAELGDLSHAEVADVLGCEVPRVKALVFRARSQLIARRAAREAPCDEIRLQLANSRGGSLRRTELRLHLRDCPGCRAYREQVKQQRRMLAAALPVVPTLGLKSSVLAAVGLSGSAGGATTLAGALGGGMVAKVAVAGALAGGGLVAADVAVESDGLTPARPVPAQSAPGAGGPASGAERVPLAPGEGDGPATGRDAAGRARGRGPIEAPPADPPVRRGPRDRVEGKADRGKAGRGPRGNGQAQAGPQHEPGSRSGGRRSAERESRAPGGEPGSKGGSRSHGAGGSRDGGAGALRGDGAGGWRGDGASEAPRGNPGTAGSAPRSSLRPAPVPRPMAGPDPATGEPAGELEQIAGGS